MLTESSYNKLDRQYCGDPYTHYCMHNIISIPKSLYLLNMFLQGNIDEISEEDISKQLECFNLNPTPILTIPLEYLEKVVQYNLVKYSYDNMDTLINNHQKILRKLR